MFSETVEQFYWKTTFACQCLSLERAVIRTQSLSVLTVTAQGGGGCICSIQPALSDGQPQTQSMGCHFFLLTIQIWPINPRLRIQART